MRLNNHIAFYFLLVFLAVNNVRTEEVAFSESVKVYKNTSLTKIVNTSGIDELKCGLAKEGTGIMKDPWYRYLEVMKDVATVFKGCDGSLHCYRKRLLQGLDRAIDSKIIKITDGVFLEKDYDDENSSFQDPRDSFEEPLLLALARRMVRLLQTHSLRIQLGVMKEVVGQADARVGHHGYRHAFPLMVGSFMVMASFLVPMGFQFLAVIGGKALILSQIALVMAMGGALQRYFGFRGGQAPVPAQVPYGGVVQHEYIVNREDAQPQPWHRALLAEGVVGVRGKPPSSTQLTQQQLFGFMHHQRLPPSTSKPV